MINVTEQVSAVSRRVGDRVLEAGEARVVTISRGYDATVEDVWDACTSAERLPRWFLPITGDLKVGGRYQLEGNAGGTIEECDPPRSFAATWEFGGGVSRIEVTFTPESGDRTRLEIAHIAHVDEEATAFWDQFGPGAVGIGWELALTLGLARHLATGETLDSKEAEAWTLSDEGKHFVKLCGQGWCEASIAFGTDKEAAEAAAERTFAFYTTPPEDAPEA